uniref:ER membrane protein complex subunit 2 n=2 Tax=Rhodosorus marinus TaxID=101924 RepID=A0A7S3ACD6_9RHOD|mmetsp:Transcript_9491/g.41017  ORF Transcript_9491/g.41017 Transcript_9491/m.41017 type:complete len:285 (+) Transcript_9491:194-1048(+)
MSTEAASVILSKKLEDGSTDGEVLELLRLAPLRRPEVVLSMRKEWRGGRDQKKLRFWDKLEQAAFAALDRASFDDMDWATRKIFSTFGSSWRLNRLIGMKREAIGDNEESMVVYENMLEKDPNNRAALKRQVTVLRTSGKLSEATAHLCWYLKIYLSDVDAWCELADLYISAGSYPQAIYCYNEALLYEKSNWALYLRLGDVYYTLSDENSMLTARHYYSKSLTLNSKHNVRAMYGLLMSSQALESGSRAQELKNKNLKNWVQEALKTVYKDKCPSKLSLLPLQ